jgi:hypothetical protein
MQGDPVLLVGNTQLSDELVQYYEGPAGTVTTITAFALNNTAGRVCQVWIHIVPSSGDAEDANQVVTSLRVPPVSAPTQVPALVAQVLAAGATLRMRSDVPDAITPLVSGFRGETT